MPAQLQQTVLDFYRYPPIGGDDWRYTFETAQARTLEIQMLSRASLADMAGAADFDQAAESLRTTEYALPQTNKGFNEVEKMLLARRAAARALFESWMHDKPIVHLFKTRDDFANLRLAVRRTSTEKGVAADYSTDGNFPPEQFAEVFEAENYDLLPDYMAEAAEQAILAYYQDKDIRKIDYAIDAAEARYRLETAAKLKSEFLLGLFRIQIDLTNIRTMLRLKFTEAEFHNVFLRGGFVGLERFYRGLDVGSEALGALFFATPYFEIVQAGAAYLAAENSFLKIEQQCDEYLAGYLKTTMTITAGPQPIIAYLLAKEDEIRKVRLILTARKNNLDAKLITDRIG